MWLCNHVCSSPMRNWNSVLFLFFFHIQIAFVALLWGIEIDTTIQMAMSIILWVCSSPMRNWNFRSYNWCRLWGGLVCSSPMRNWNYLLVCCLCICILVCSSPMRNWNVSVQQEIESIIELFVALLWGIEMQYIRSSQSGLCT